MDCSSGGPYETPHKTSLCQVWPPLRPSDPAGVVQPGRESVYGMSGGEQASYQQVAGRAGATGVEFGLREERVNQLDPRKEQHNA